MTAQMRTGPAARDPSFRGIDPPALNQVIRQLQDAESAIRGWLNGHRPPPGVSAAGYRQADEVARWAADQLGMLTRRYNFAVTHPDKGDGVQAPTPPSPAPGPGPSGGGETGGGPGVGGSPESGSGSGGGSGGSGGPGSGGGTFTPVTPPKTGPSPRQPTPNGAGDLGAFPDRRAAAKAAKADALAVAAAAGGGVRVPGSVWTHLKANAGDPDYTEKLYEGLGPAATAGLLRSAEGDRARLAVIEESLGTASHHLTMDTRWLRAFLAEAGRAGVRPVAVQVLTGADMSRRTREALGGLDLGSASPHAAEAGTGAGDRPHQVPLLKDDPQSRPAASAPTG
ncbi:hypothetical protein [Spirillospora sp. NBC_01491]|uniref:hypothetical protein n=1 Tax=Spirillospora sp. NBC_01491 TaxID=2976007 RepID=UPI002E351EE8|nr:hypothetical protein [Spirillospora sp. NBC_01491]